MSKSLGPRATKVLRMVPARRFSAFVVYRVRHTAGVRCTHGRLSSTCEATGPQCSWTGVYAGHGYCARLREHVPPKCMVASSSTKNQILYADVRKCRWFQGTSFRLHAGFDHQSRAVDVNRPVRSRCAHGATLAARARAAIGGLTYPARLCCVLW